MVLENLYIHGYLTRTETDSLKKRPIVLDYSVETYSDGNALYFREAVVEYLESFCEQNDLDLYSDEPKIYTSDTGSTICQKVCCKQATEYSNSLMITGKTNPWQDGCVKSWFYRGIAKKRLQVLKEHPDNADSIDYYLNKPHSNGV